MVSLESNRKESWWSLHSNMSSLRSFTGKRGENVHAGGGLGTSKREGCSHILSTEACLCLPDWFPATEPNEVSPAPCLSIAKSTWEEGRSVYIDSYTVTNSPHSFTQQMFTMVGAMPEHPCARYRVSWKTIRVLSTSPTPPVMTYNVPLCSESHEYKKIVHCFFILITFFLLEFKTTISDHLHWACLLLWKSLILPLVFPAIERLDQKEYLL